MANRKKSWSCSHRVEFRVVVGVGALLVLFEASALVIVAQQPTTSPAPVMIPATSAPATTSAATAPDEQYRIGPRDVLEIRVFGRPQLSRDTVRVGENGVITMPLIGDVQAACRTERELAQEIQTRYLKYQRNPQVDVFVKQYQSQSVAVLGAVKSPSRFELRRRIRLLELLSYAGGQTERAGNTIQIVPAEAPASACEAPQAEAASGGPESAEQGISIYNLRDTLRGEGRANPYVRPGDIITLLDADQAYIVGNVLSPRTIPLTEPITITRAVAMAAGTGPNADKNRVRIVRQTPSGKQEIYVDLDKIRKRQAQDVPLQANDIVEVPGVGGVRGALNTMLRTLVPSFAQLPAQLPLRVVY